MLLEVEELHLLHAAGEGRRGLRREVAGALAGAISLGDKFSDLGVDERRRLRGVGRDQAEEFLEDRHRLAQVHAGDDRSFAHGQQIRQLGQTRTLGADPIDLPGVFDHRAMFMRVVAVDPDQVAAPDLMGTARDARPTLAAQAEDELMAGKVVALDVVLRAREQMARAGHRIEHLLMGGIRGRVERDRETVGDGGQSHGRIIQPAGRGMPFKTVGFGVE